MSKLFLKSSVRIAGLFLLLFSSVPAQARTNFSLFWAPNSVTPTGGAAVTPFRGGVFGFTGGGAAIMFGGPRGGVEVGGIYQIRQIHATNASNTQTIVSVPVVGKLHLGKVFHVAAGGYVDYHMAGAGAQPTSVGNKFDYGVKGGAGIQIPLKNFALFATGYYKMGLGEMNVAANSVKYNQIDVLAGITFGGTK